MENITFIKSLALIGTLLLGVGHTAMAIEINIGTNNQVNTGTISGVQGCEQGSGKIKSEQRSVPSFSKLSVDGIFNVQVEIGASGPITVSADDNLLKLISTKVSDDELSVTTTKSYCTQADMTLVVPAEKLTALKLSGSNTVAVTAAEALTNTLEITAGGTGAVSLQGSGPVLRVDAQDTAEVDAGGFLADEAEVVTSGAAVAKVRVKNRLSGKCTDASEIHYSGSPSVVSVETADAADLTKDD